MAVLFIDAFQVVKVVFDVILFIACIDTGVEHPYLVVYGIDDYNLITLLILETADTVHLGDGEFFTGARLFVRTVIEQAHATDYSGYGEQQADIDKADGLLATVICAFFVVL